MHKMPLDINQNNKKLLVSVLPILYNMQVEILWYGTALLKAL